MLDLFQDSISNILRTLANGLKLPVTLLLVLLAVVTLFLLGTLLTEIFMEHRHLKVHMPELVDKIRAAGKGSTAGIIRDSSLLLRQKDALTELTKHPDLTPLMRESLAIRLIAQEKDFYDRRTQRTDLIAKTGPMLGLMGTLIPLGPGIIALGQGDTYTLSTSLLMAFDTTVAGLACAAAALIISSIRKRWYRNYMSILETLMECILETENDIENKNTNQTADQTADAASQDPRKKLVIDTYRETYLAAVRAGSSEEEAKAFARSRAAGLLNDLTNRGMKAGEPL